MAHQYSCCRLCPEQSPMQVPALRVKLLLTWLFGGCPKVQLIWPPRNCFGFKTESHGVRLKVSRAVFLIGCKIYMSEHASAQTRPSEDVWTETTVTQRLDLEHKHN